MDIDARLCVIVTDRLSTGKPQARTRLHLKGHYVNMDMHRWLDACCHS